jgi:HicB family
MVVCMDITPYIEGLRRDLAAAAASGSADVQAAAEQLALAIDPAMRMALLEALSDAAAEISQDLGGGSIDVRLKGRDPQFVVTPPPAGAASGPGGPGGERDDEPDDEEGPVARITLRLPESLKQRAEEAAGRRGQSLNSWLVSAVRAAARERAINVDIDLSGIPFGSDAGRGRRGPGQSFSGWVR